MSFTSIKDIDLKNKKVLLRADLNVPARRGKVTDTSRIDRLKPTIDYLVNAGAKILIMSHFGRPEGSQSPEMSLAFLIPSLEKCWEVPVIFSLESTGAKAESAAATLGPGEILLLENMRFHKGEEANDRDFARELAKLGDIYVNDAFSSAHRAHASTEAITHILPAYAGLLMEEELIALNKALGSPQTPVAAIIGGSKISTKLKLLNNLVEKVDYLILGGGMANTFLYAEGSEIGNSLCEKDMAGEAAKIIIHAGKNNCEIILPIDCVAVKEIKTEADYKIVPGNKIPEDYMAIDIGPDSISHITRKIAACKTIIWNGPMGVFEIKPFDKGTTALAKYVAAMTENSQCISIAGGGDTVSALENADVADKFTYISTAGGAFLEWMEGKTLPGIAALEDTQLLP